MTERISFLNDKFLPHDQAFVHIEDRGFQLADGIYEVILFYNNKLIDFDWHIDRLYRSLAAIELKFNKSATEIKNICLELFKQNNLQNGSIYLQITRGASPRNQAFPAQYIPTLVATVSPLKAVAQDDLKNGMAAVTYQDIRWGRCDIKTIGLLAGVLSKQYAAQQNAVEAILIKDGYITEGSFSNVFIVKNKKLITRKADNHILCGITRNRIIDLAQKNNIEVIEKDIRLEELMSADEVFLTSSTLLVRPISQIDNHPIGSGATGEISKKLIKLYNDFINE